MGHRALVAYERPDDPESYNLHYSQWGALNLRLKHEIITEHLDYLHHEACYVVSTEFEVTAYRTLWFGLQYDAALVEDAPTVENGALHTVRWYDGEPVNDGYVRGQFQALKAVVGDMLDRGVFTHKTAIDYITETPGEWVGDHRDLLIRTP